ncbi:MAG: M48 family metallopeptidase [Gammaproteobacteria bacterium]|nr:M48 family metallopeptidase [Gammaproteobacteria bacterium]
MPSVLKSVLLTSLFAACAGLAAGPALAADDLPNIGSSTERALPLSQEQAIGDAIMRQVRKQAPLADDPEIGDYINRLGFQLVAHNPDGKNHQFQFFVIRDPSINAFALPGGYIGIHTGLVTTAERESELAAVLGHEIAHVTQRHLARRLEAQSQMSLPVLAGMLIGVAAIAAGSGDAGIAALTASQAGAQQHLINYTRSNESEADRIGIDTLAGAGFDPFAVPSMFERMAQAYRYDRKPPEFLMTHPVTQNRVAEGRQRAATFGPGGDRDPLAYALFRARLKSLTGENPQELLKTYEHALAESGDKATAARYGKALALTELRRYDEALPLLEELQRSHPDRLTFALALARLDIAAGRPGPAQSRLEALLRANPGHHAATLTYAQALLLANQPERARTVLQEHVLGHEQDVATYRLLAEAQGRAGYMDEVYESQAQEFFLKGDLDKAIRHLRQALRQRSQDPYARQRIQARLEQYDDLLEQELSQR